MEKFQNNNELRHIYKSIRNQMEADLRQQKSLMIIDNFLALLESDFKGANIFLCYYPYSSEVDLLPLYSRLLELGKQLYFPISKVDDHSLDFKAINDLEVDFHKGAFDIMEPSDKLTSYQGQSAIVITPGLIFDEAFNRVGYGAGFYDRFFEKYPNNVKLGVCFSEQISSDINPDIHDVPMDYLVTDNCILRG